MLLEFEFDIFYEQSQDQCDGQVARGARAGGRMILDNFRETNVVLLSTYTINLNETM